MISRAHFNRHIDARSARQLVDFQRGVYIEGVERVVSAVVERQLAPFRQRIHREDLFRAAQRRHAYLKQADRAQSDDSDRIG